MSLSQNCSLSNDFQTPTCVFSKNNVSVSPLVVTFNSLATVLLLLFCVQARPWFRFSTRTSSVAWLALCLVAFTRATLVVVSRRER